MAPAVFKRWVEEWQFVDAADQFDLETGTARVRERGSDCWFLSIAANAMPE
jgi:hypothetical protein